jgi:hypothetical protein
VIVKKGGMLSLDTIFEEHEDHNNLSRLCTNLKPNTCLVSSLVATIDEIRKYTSEKSPQHVYHIKSHWEDLEKKILMKQAHLNKDPFVNDYKYVTFSYDKPWFGSFISNENSEKFNIIKEMTNYCQSDSIDKTPLINAILSDSPILGSKADTHSCESSDL